MTDIIVQWANYVVVNAPVLLFLAMVAYDLRRELKKCIEMRDAALRDFIAHLESEIPKR